MKSLKTKLLVVLTSMTLLMCLGIGGGAFGFAVFGMGQTVKRDISAFAEQTAYTVGIKLGDEVKVLQTIACMDTIGNPESDTKEVKALLAAQATNTEFLSIGIADATGKLCNSDGTEADIKEKEYFTKAFNGQSYITEPIVDSKDNSVVMVYAVPIVFEGKTTGVLVGQLDGTILSEVVNGNRFGETGAAFIINNEGTFIAHEDMEYVKTQYNPIEEGKEKALISAMEKVNRASSGTAQYSFQGEKKNLGFSKIPGTDWSVCVYITHNEIYKPLIMQLYQIIGGTILFTFLGGILINVIARRIASHISTTTGYINQMADGDLTIDIIGRSVELKDEIGMMARGLKEMQASVRTIITGIQKNSDELGVKSIELNENSQIITNLSEAITQAITEIAEGTSFQSNELIEITTVLDQFNEKLNVMAGQIEDVDATSRKIDAMAVRSSKEMNELGESVTHIHKTFDVFEESVRSLNDHITQINAITNLITDVANQTNLLALNASIEAARAGEAGKGFAVVAEEIGNLAEQSKESSVQINAILDGITKNTEVLVRDAKEMGGELEGQFATIRRSLDTFHSITDHITDVIPKIQGIKQSGNEIDKEKNRILEKVDELSSVSEEISASSEEIAASTEEMNQSILMVSESALQLNTMTEEMNVHVNQFKVTES